MNEGFEEIVDTVQHCKFHKEFAWVGEARAECKSWHTEMQLIS